ncbi:outer membrane beta-barrel protein [Mucilaginibacter gracilis]|uniref:Outer membrane beta-barrel protein n=1 Tax=Mucilaginibacter gracilis TaxID=423350 RepID=A0A495J134_9SPHI|nr:outer membrane beta-barrel protein [Mucilaginibacter gracilis]
MYFLNCLFSLLLLPVLLLAQQQKEVKGTIYTETDMPLAGATISVFDYKSNKRIGSTTSDSTGNFKITINNTEAYLYITHIGFLPYKVNIINTGAVVVKLKPQTQDLSEVVIKAQKPLIEQQFDRMVVNVDGSPKAGMNAADILKKIPGVNIINQNEIVLEGKGVTINIDGKPTHLNGNELMNLLNSTQPTGISKIEVVYNPSAKFDAQGNGGIINIKTLKRNKPGYDAYLSLTAGHGWKYFSNNDISAGLNYRSGNNYIFGTYSYGIGKQSQEIQKNTYLTDINQRLLDSIAYAIPYHSQNIRMGWDHYLNKNDVIGMLFTGYDSYSIPNINTQTGIYNLKATNKDSSRYSVSTDPRRSIGGNVNVNYKVVIDSVKHQEISMDADGGIFKYNNDNNLSLLAFNEQGIASSPLQQLLQSGNTLSHIYSYKADYSQKYYKGILEAGIKASYVKINNEFDVQSGVAGQPLNNEGNNDFIYREAVLAGYVSTKQTFAKFTIQLGLRAEQTYTNGNSVTVDSIVKRSYLNIFPNVVAGYKLKNSSFSLSYSRRIGRPPYNYLNPFFINNSAYAANNGNPYLKPSFTDNYRLGYNIGSKFNFSVTYSNVKDVITDLKLVNDQTKVTTNIKANLAHNNNEGWLMQLYYRAPHGCAQYLNRFGRLQYSLA